MSIFEVDDTIVAIASPLAPALRGIVRMSGREVVPILTRVGLIADDTVSSRPRRFSTELKQLGALGSIGLDVMLWPNTRSYTGQPSAELHLIGSLPILDAVVERLIESGARAARTGEFTMRSFLAGRLDLTQAEAVLGVIDAEDARTLNEALSQLAGNLSRPLQSARGELLNLLADVEAGLDFVDEDIEFISDEHLQQRLGIIRDILLQTGQQMHERAASQSALEIVLRGLPNAGKSCLLNALSQTESAIVTEQAGTTRDSISVECEFHGHRVRITDTAGIEQRAASDPDAEVSSKAQQQAADAASRADVCLWCVDSSEISPPESDGSPHRRSVENWLVLTKSDLNADASIPIQRFADGQTEFTRVLTVSALTGTGVDTLRTEIAVAAERLDATEVGSVMGTAARCRGALIAAVDAIETAVELTRQSVGHELVAAEIREAAARVGDVTGEVYTDDLLDRVFSRFCIGK